MSREPITTAIPRFSVSRPVTVVMLLAAILVVGYIAYTRIRLSLFPEDLEGSQLHVSVPYPNASPRDIEEKITRKIEDILGTVPDVARLTSYASPGYSYTRVELRPGTSLREAYAAVSDRMDRVKPLLPDDVDRIWVRRYDPGSEPMMNLVAQVPRDMDDAAYRMEAFVKPVLQRIDGVGNVDLWGAQSREVNIDLIDERIRSHRIDVSAMLGTLRGQNVALGGGHVVEGGRKIYIRSLGRFTSLEQIREVMIDPVRRLRLGDVANVSLRQPRREWIYRVDHQPAIGLQITRDSTGNIDRISREVRAALPELERMPQLEGVHFEVFSDQGKDVRDAIGHLEEAGLWGGLFAALILYVFLRAPRMTGILTLSIPLSLLCTIVTLFFMGWSLNLATMMGLLLAVGMVVDNAIVIVENIYRLRQEGVDGTHASITGTGEVGLAVVMSTCTTIVVFLPLILMGRGHEFSFWMFRIGVPVIVSLVASLVIALVFVPLAAQRMSRGQRHQDIAPVAWVRARYGHALRWVLTHRVDATLVALLLLATLWIPYQAVPRSNAGILGRSGGRSLHLYYDLPSGNTLEQTDAFFTGVEQFIERHKDFYGVERIESRFRNNSGRIQLKLRQKANDAWYVAAWENLLLSLDLAAPPMDRHTIEIHLRDNFELPAGIICRSIARNSGAPQDSVISFSIFGEDTTTLIGLAEEAARRLATIPGLLSVDTDMERGGQELRITLDRDRSRRLGINPQAVSGGISNTIRGLEVGRMPVPDGREIRIYAQLGEVEHTRIDDVRSMSFPSESGMDVPLESLASLSIGKSMSTIYREARQTVMRITARMPRQDSRGLQQAIDKAMDGFELPRGYRFDRGSYFSGGRSDAALQFALTLAVIFVFLLMGLLFESFILPLAVLAAVPFSLLGVYWTLHLTGTSLDLMATIGMVILVGVVVNNAIVLVDLANRLRAAGRDRLDALLEAGHHRFRPILMTTLTTVSGMIPMAVGNSRIVGVPYAPLGRTMIGGLLVSALLTLVVVPLLYTLLDDLREHAARVWRSAFPAPTPAPGAAAGAARAARAE